MPSQCRFELNKGNGIYFSGETIIGTVHLNTTSDKNVRDVSILFLGEGKVKWVETESSTENSTNTTNYTSHEIYINNRTNVHGEGNLPAGKHTYTFNITLPLECPTSCEGKYGYVRYELSLKLNRFYRFNNVFKKPLTVIKTIDLNLSPALRMPITAEDVKKFSWPLSKGKILYTLQILYGAYAPGQAVKYSLHIKNQSMTDTKGYSLELCKKITFTAKSPRREQRNVKEVIVQQSSSDKCLRLTNSVFKGHFIIPATPPTTKQDCIICVNYKIKFTLIISGCHTNCEFKIPLVIGTIPIRESLPASQFVPNRLREQLPATAPELSSHQNASNELPPSYDDIYPPSFEEAVGLSGPFIDTDTDEHNRIVGFKPLYPMYKL